MLPVDYARIESEPCYYPYNRENCKNYITHFLILCVLC